MVGDQGIVPATEEAYAEFRPLSVPSLYWSSAVITNPCRAAPAPKLLPSITKDPPHLPSSGFPQIAISLSPQAKP